MIITPHKDQVFEAYSLSGLLQLQSGGDIYFFDERTLAPHKKLLEVACPSCKNHFPSREKLQAHLKSKHGVSYWYDDLASLRV